MRWGRDALVALNVGPRTAVFSDAGVAAPSQIFGRGSEFALRNPQSEIQRRSAASSANLERSPFVSFT